MIEGGEDVRFIARRMLILSSEDIGNTNPTAFIMANNAFQAVATMGYLKVGLYSANALYTWLHGKFLPSDRNFAQQLVKQTGDLSVPIHLRNAPTETNERVGYGEDYKYSDYQNNSNQEYLPDELKSTPIYLPGNNTRKRDKRFFKK
jgi:putative ATPase